MSGKKRLYPLLWVVITLCLIRSRILLGVADEILVSIDRTCRTLSTQCTGSDYNSALLVTALLINGMAGLILVGVIAKIVHTVRKTS